MVGLIEFCQREIWGSVADMQGSRARPHPERLKRKNHEGQLARNLRHGAAKLLGRLPHLVKDHGTGRQPEENKRAENYGKWFLEFVEFHSSNPKEKWANYRSRNQAFK